MRRVGGGHCLERRFRLAEDRGRRAQGQDPPRLSLDEGQRERVTLRDARNHFERQYLLWVLEKVQGNRTEAALLLGLHRSMLAAKIRQYRLRDLISPARR